jgi:hypothetical protein
VTGQWFSLGTPVSSTNKTDSHDITEILLKMALNNKHQPFFLFMKIMPFSLLAFLILKKLTLCCNCVILGTNKGI